MVTFLRKKIFTLFLVLITVLCHEAYANGFNDSDDNSYSGRVDAIIKAGFKRQLAQLHYLQPIFQNADNLLYLDIIGHADLQKSEEGNFGFGFRTLKNDSIYGIYSFYDYRNTKYDNHVHQATVGLEYFRTFLEIRGNFYLPFSKEKLVKDDVSLGVNRGPLGTIVAKGGEQKYEVPMKGFDIEIGGNVPFHPALSVYSAYYNFFDKDVTNTHGVRGRATYQINNLLSLNTECSYDNERKFHAFIGGQFTWHFDQKLNRTNERNLLRSKMTHMPIRDIDIFTKSKKKKHQDAPRIYQGDWIAINDGVTKASGDRVFNLDNVPVDAQGNPIGEGVMYVDQNGNVQLVRFGDNDDQRQLVHIDAQVRADILANRNNVDEAEYVRLEALFLAGEMAGNPQNVHVFDAVVGRLYPIRDALIGLTTQGEISIDQSFVESIRAIRDNQGLDEEDRMAALKVVGVIYRDLQNYRRGLPNTLVDSAGINSADLFNNAWKIASKNVDTFQYMAGNLADIARIETSGYCLKGRMNRLFAVINQHFTRECIL